MLGLVQFYLYTSSPGGSEEKGLQLSWCVWTGYKNAINTNSLHVLITYYVPTLYKILYTY